MNFSLAGKAGGHVIVPTAKLGLDHAFDYLDPLIDELGLEDTLEQLGELLSVLLDRGVKAQFGDEVVWVDRLAVGELHDGKQSLQVGDDPLWTVLFVRQAQSLVISLLIVMLGIPRVQRVAKLKKKSGQMLPNSNFVSTHCPVNT